MTVSETTKQFAEFASETNTNTLPDSAMLSAKRLTIDTVACAIAGVHSEIGRRLRTLRSKQGGIPEATMLGVRNRLPLTAAAYVNSHAANSHDADDTLLNMSHHACAVVMPTLAVAEHLNSSGSDFLAAVAIGFEVAASIGMSLPLYRVAGDKSVEMNWPGYSWAVFGTVAAVGRLFKVSTAEMRNAFGIGFMSTPIRGPFALPPGVGVPMTKYTMYGSLAEAGINAVLLAKDGFTGDTKVLDQDHYFWRAFGVEECNFKMMTEACGKRWYINDTSIKLYPAARPHNEPAHALQRIMIENGLSANEIEKVRVRLPAHPLSVQWAVLPRPVTPLEAPHNLPHILAMIALQITPGPKWHDPKVTSLPEVLQFCQKVEVEGVPEWREIFVEQIRSDGYLTRRPMEMIVKSRGKEFRIYEELTIGDPWSPEMALSDEAISSKFRNFSVGCASEDAIEKTLSALWALDQMSNLRELMRPLVEG